MSNWLVRFLEPAPLTTATTALSLYWAGIAVGRLLAARFADRFDHVLFAATSSAAMSVALVGGDPGAVAPGLDRAVRPGRCRHGTGLPDDHRRSVATGTRTGRPP